MIILKEFIKNPSDLPELKVLILSKNSLKDEGIRELANGLLERFTNTKSPNYRLLNNLVIN